SLCFGARSIIDHLVAGGAPIERVFLTSGLSRNNVLLTPSTAKTTAFTLEVPRSMPRRLLISGPITFLKPKELNSDSGLKRESVQGGERHTSCVANSVRRFNNFTLHSSKRCTIIFKLI